MRKFTGLAVTLATAALLWAEPVSAAPVQYNLLVNNITDGTAAGYDVEFLFAVNCFNQQTICFGPFGMPLFEAFHNNNLPPCAPDLLTFNSNANPGVGPIQSSVNTVFPGAFSSVLTVPCNCFNTFVEVAITDFATCSVVEGFAVIPANLQNFSTIFDIPTPIATQIGLSGGFSFTINAFATPEIDPQDAVLPVGLVLGGLAIVADRRRRQPSATA